MCEQEEGVRGWWVIVKYLQLFSLRIRSETAPKFSSINECEPSELFRRIRPSSVLICLNFFGKKSASSISCMHQSVIECSEEKARGCWESKINWCDCSNVLELNWFWVSVLENKEKGWRLPVNFEWMKRVSWHRTENVSEFHSCSEKRGRRISTRKWAQFETLQHSSSVMWLIP